ASTPQIPVASGIDPIASIHEHDLRRHDADCPIAFGSLNERGEPVRLNLRVVVEECEVGSRGAASADVVACGESYVPVERKNPAVRKLLTNELDGSIGRSVIDNHDL